MRFILAGNQLRIGGGGGRWCQVFKGIFDALGFIEKIKDSLVAGAFIGSYQLLCLIFHYAYH